MQNKQEENSVKIFYVGMQRCGTKSFGELFRQNGFRVCSWADIERLELPRLVIEGKWLDILQSGIFEQFDVFEDGPFQNPEFSLFLSNYVPNSKFVYFHRPADDWYKSMVTHSHGRTLGNAGRHCYKYDRLDELRFIREQAGVEMEKLNLTGMKHHYTRCYELHKEKILYLFADLPQERFYADALYNKEKFDKMNMQLGLGLSDTQEVHTHKSPLSFSDVMQEHYSLLQLNKPAPEKKGFLFGKRK